MNEMFVTEHDKWFSTRYCYMDGLCEGAMCTTRTPLGKKEQWLCIYKRNDFAVVVPLEIRQREWSDRGIAHLTFDFDGDHMNAHNFRHSDLLLLHHCDDNRVREKTWRWWRRRTMIDCTTHCD